MNLTRHEWLEALADYTHILVTSRKIFEKIKNLEDRSGDLAKLKSLIDQCKLTSMSTPHSDQTPGAFAHSIFGQTLERKRYWEELFKMESFHQTKLKDEVGVLRAHLCNDANQATAIAAHLNTVIKADSDDYVIVRNVVMLFHNSKKTIEINSYLSSLS